MTPGLLLLRVCFDAHPLPQYPYGASVLGLPRSPDSRHCLSSSYLRKMRVLALRTWPREDGVEGEKR